MAPPRWRALFLESQSIFSPFLTQLLRDAGLDVVRTDRTLDMRALETMRPDVLVVDANDVAIDYERMVAAARARVPGLRVIAWADRASPLFEVLRREGVETIPYDLEPVQAVRAIRAALRTAHETER
jgi:chemotaxis response regulator CheB